MSYFEAGTSITEEELVARGRRGDVDAFNLLVEKYQQQVYNLALRMLGNAEAAADATQEAFFAAFRNVRSFRGGSFRAWLFRIAANSCYDELRARQRRPAASLDALLDDPEKPLDFPAEGELPEDFALRRELARGLHQGLATLPADQRLVVLLSDVHGLRYEEVAEATGSNLGTVKSRLSRARAHLRDYLQQHGELLPRAYRHKE